MITYLGDRTMIKSEIEFWKNVILSGKKYDPKDQREAAAFDIAEYLLKRETDKIAA